MIDEKYENLTDYEKGEFRRLCNYLLSHTFINKEKYDSTKDMMVLNEDYKMAVRLFATVKDYLYYIGWNVIHDDMYGVVYVLSNYGNNHRNFDKFTTLFLYALRYIFEEEREKINNYSEIRTSTSDIVDKMISLGVITKDKPNFTQLKHTQSILKSYNIIERIESYWDKEGNHLVIFPSILSVISNSDITDLCNEIDEMKLEDTNKEQENNLSGEEDDEE